MMNGWAPFQIGKFLIVAGAVLIGIGLLFMAGSKFSFFGLGRLPGDIAYKGKHTQFYFPIVTCLMLSAVFTFILWLIGVLSRK